VNLKLPHRLVLSPGTDARGMVASRPDAFKAELDALISRALIPAGPVLPAAARSPTRHMPLTAAETLGHAGTLVWGPAPGDLAARAFKALKDTCEQQRYDLALIPEGEEMGDFAVLAMDMDSTVITIECIDELAAFAGKKAEVAAITEAAMRGKISDYAESLRQRVALLAGVPVEAAQEVIDQSLRLTPGARQLLAGAKAAGLTTLLVSGGFTLFTTPVSETLGFDRVRSNVLEVQHGLLTGRLVGEIVDGEAKASALKALCAELGVPPNKSIAIGDGANDLPMMALAGLSVAHKAKPAVRSKAMRAIQYSRLDSLLVGWKSLDETSL
jgi:phosphoserine phosphatase